MPDPPGMSNACATLPVRHLKAMIRLVHHLHHLGRSPIYQAAIAHELPECARLDPGNDAVMMGYDFHLTPDGPRLIEVNTNAGGSWLAHQVRCRHGRVREDHAPPVWLHRGLLQEWCLFRSHPGRPLHSLAILDEAPEQQFLYPEMVVFRDYCRHQGLVAEIVPPEALAMDETGVRLDGQPIDMIYNRHCDFYLETAPLAGLRAAYLALTVALTPNPRAFGLLADKRRLATWCDADRLTAWGWSGEKAAFLKAHIPFCQLMQERDADRWWADRNHLVFKPVAKFGSKGVFLGDKLTRGRFQELDPRFTLVQQRVPPGVATLPDGQGTLKADWRLFAYQDRPTALAVRCYRGQVTSFREPGSGYGHIRLVW